MPADLTPTKPRTGDGLLDLIARPVFGAGLSWHVVEKAWPSTRQAFDRFSVRKVGAYGEGDVRRILATPGVIANERKIRAVIECARIVAAHGRRYGSARKWLDGCGDLAERTEALRRLPGVGPWGAHYALAKMGYPVPPWEPAAPEPAQL